MPPRSKAADALDGEPLAVLRRAPFSGNPKVGARGQRAQQRILEAALHVFGEVGYHDCGVIGITRAAGCSRAAFYQYFASKEDVFRHLAGQVGRQLMASAEAMPPVTPDAAGWATLHAWVERHGQVYARYEPVFRAFQSAVETDEAVASGANRIEQRTVGAVLSRLTETDVASRHLDPVIAVLQQCMTRTRQVIGVLRAALPDGTYPEARVDDALTDVVHRTLFGLDRDVNVHGSRRRALAQVDPPPMPPAEPIERAELTGVGARTITNLLDAGNRVLVARGYHGTRVDDVAAAAGVSHGVFYRYFENKDHLVRVLAMRATQTVVDAFNGIPDIAGSPGAASSSALHDWLGRYNAAYASETAIIRVWVDATAHDPRLGAESAAAVDWGRRRLVRFLKPRGFGDVETEAVVAVALIDGFGTRRQEPAVLDATALVVERGLLGFGAR